MWFRTILCSNFRFYIYNLNKIYPCATHIIYTNINYIYYLLSSTLYQICSWPSVSFAITKFSLWRRIYIGTRSSHGQYQDAVLLTSLRCQAKPYVTRNHVVLANAGFDGRQVKFRDIIPPVRRHGTLCALEKIAHAELVRQARLDGLYRQHWKCETVDSVIKRKLGDIVRSRITRLHFLKIFFKGHIYNLLAFWFLICHTLQQSNYWR